MTVLENKVCGVTMGSYTTTQGGGVVENSIAIQMQRRCCYCSVAFVVNTLLS